MTDMMMAFRRWSLTLATCNEQHANEVYWGLHQALHQGSHALLSPLRLAQVVLPSAHHTGTSDLLRLVIVYDPFSSQAPSATLLTILHALLPSGQHAGLPDDLLRQLPPVLPLEPPTTEEPSSVGILYEQTAPTLLTFRGHVDLPAHLHVPQQESGDEHSLTPSIPLTNWLSSWLLKVRRNITGNLFRLLTPVYPQAMQTVYEHLLADAQLYLLTSSGKRLHDDVMQQDVPFAGLSPHEALQAVWQRHRYALDERVAQEHSLLCALEEAIASPHGLVRGVLLYPCFPASALLAAFDDLSRQPHVAEGAPPWIALHRLLSRFDGLWNMDLLDEEGMVLLRCGYDCFQQRWIPLEHDSDHSRQQVQWARWMCVLCEMIGKHYARSPELPTFPEQSVTLRHKQWMPRHHGKGKPKEKWVEQPIQYQLLTYEVSMQEQEARVETMDGGREPAEGAHKRGNWLTQAAPDEVLYVQRTIDTYERRYPVRRDGTRREGSVEVVHQDPKWVLRLRPEKRKTQMVRKVTSALHQAEQKEGTFHAGPSPEER